MSGEKPTGRMTFTKIGGTSDSDYPFEAQFNPTSLQYTITNTAQRSGGQQRQQRVDDSSAKLTFDLVFDDTDDGTNVRIKTQKIAKLMEPQGTQNVPPQVQVDWGDFSFTGVLDSYKETIDFFSEDGVPLRATVSLGLSNTSDKNKAPKKVFEFATPGASSASVDDGDFSNVVDVPTGDSSTTDIASDGGDPSRGRDIAAQNGIEDPRNPGADADTLTVDGGGPVLNDPVAFAAGASAGASAGFGASAGIGFGASAGIGVSAGVGIGASAGFSAGASAGFSGGVSAGFSAGVSANASAGASAGVGFGAGASAGAGVGIGAGASAGFGASAGAGFSAGASAGFSASAGVSAGAGAVSTSTGFATFRAGGAASAGVSASAGAFSLLRAPTAPQRRSFDPTRLLVRQQTSTIPIRNATFAVGGRIEGSGSSGFNADVGATTTLSGRIDFEED